MDELDNKDLIEHLEKNTGVLKTEIKEAFETVDRKDFVEEDYKVEAYHDYPLPIGFNQTVSQPTVVALMLSLLKVKRGERVLDIGCGSGWTTVLLGFLVGTEGEVVAIDIVSELVELTRNRAHHYNREAPNIAVFHASEKKAIYSDTFDKILVNASFEKIDSIPKVIKENLKENGLMVSPVGNSLIVFHKKGGEFKEKIRLPYSFSFVPYINQSKSN